MVKLPKQLVLASSSPRRKELLEALKLDFITHPSKFIEKEARARPERAASEQSGLASCERSELTKEQLALHNAIGKAQDVASHYKNSLIIGVDTIVAFKGHQIGKPKNSEDAKSILRLLSNTTHEVISAICIIDSDNFKNITATETTLVTLDRLDEAEIEAYVQSGEGTDKAGGFAIQGRGALFIKKIDGDYFNVVGLPIFRLKKLLREFGIKSLI